MITPFIATGGSSLTKQHVCSTSGTWRASALRSKQSEISIANKYELMATCITFTEASSVMDNTDGNSRHWNFELLQNAAHYYRFTGLTILVQLQ